jgi:hypothetical protein
MEQFINYSPLAPVELSANVSSSATVLPLVGGGLAGFSTSGTYRLLLDGEELVTVTAYSGGNATVVRGAEGTAAVAHNAGANVIPVLTKAAMAQFASDIGGGGGSSYTQDCSAGGSIIYNGPATVPTTLILTGSPAGSFDYQLPDTSVFVVAVVNQTTQTVSVGNVNNPDAWPILGEPYGSDGPQWFGSSLQGGIYTLVPLTGWTPEGLPVNVTDASLVNFQDTVTGLSIWRIASLNISLPGAIPYLETYALLNLQDTVSYGGTPPDQTGNPGTVPVPSGVAVAYVSYQGVVIEDVTGESIGVAHSVVYPNSPWDTQRTARNLLAPDYGDTLIGPSAVGSGYIMGFPNIGSGSFYETNHVKFIIQCRVVSTSGSTEAAGDMCTIIQEYDFVTVGGSMVGILPGSQAVTFLDQTSSGTIGTVSFPAVTAVSGTQIAPEIITPAGFDPSTVLDITIFTESYST